MQTRGCAGACGLERLALARYVPARACRPAAAALTTATLLALLAAKATAQSCTAPSLDPPSSVTVGQDPERIGIADFNADGIADLAVAHGPVGGNLVSILLGTAGGGFGGSSTLAMGTDVVDVVVADFDRNGRPDLAVVNYGVGAGSVTVRLATGPTTFGAPVPYPVSAEPGFAAVADYDRDGDLDIVTSSLSNDLSLLRNNGNGTFAAAANVAAGAPTVHVAAADLDRDGDADLAAVDYDGSRLLVLKGNGGGAFAAATPFAVSIQPEFASIADFNEDGILDVAVGSSGAGVVGILIGYGSGAFTGPTDFPASAVAGSGTASITTGDHDGDGHVDLAVTGNGLSVLSVLLGTGTGAFGAATDFPAGSVPYGSAAGDFDRDGRTDVIVANAGEDTLSVFHNSSGFACPNASFGPGGTRARRDDRVARPCRRGLQPGWQA